MKINFISYLYLFFVFIFSILSCSDDKYESSFLKSNKVNQDSALLKQSYLKVKQYLEKDHLDSLKYENKKFQNLAYKTLNSFYLGKSFGVLGYLKLIENESDSAFYYLNQSKNNFIGIKDSLNIAKALANMAIIQSNQGDFSGSELTAVESLNYLKQHEDAEFISSIYNCLAISSSSTDNPIEAIYWQKKAIEFSLNSYNKKLYQNNLAVSYISSHDYFKAIDQLTALFNDSIVENSPELKSKVIDNLAYAKWKQNSEANVEKDFLEALKIRENSDDLWGQNASHSRLSEFYSKKNSTKSVYHAHKMYEVAKLLKSPDDQLEALQKLIPLESLENTKRYAMTYTKLSDSIITSRNLSKDQFAKIRYDSNKNRTAVQDLKIQTAEQEIQLQKSKIYYILLITIIILFFIGFYSFYKIQKVKSLKILTEEIHASESKMAQKVHDELANNLYQVISNLENQSDFISDDRKNEVLGKMDEIYVLSRNISREINTIYTDERYPDLLRELISSYKNNQTNIILSGFNGDEWKNVNKDIKLQFYKILQELLTNMKKHSQATLVVLSFKFEKKQFQFNYSDNGIGIDKKEFQSKNGIHITENRMEKIKGQINFAFEPEKGLKIYIWIPL